MGGGCLAPRLGRMAWSRWRSSPVPAARDSRLRSSSSRLPELGPTRQLAGLPGAIPRPSWRASRSAFSLYRGGVAQPLEVLSGFPGSGAGSSRAAGGLLANTRRPQPPTRAGGINSCSRSEAVSLAAARPPGARWTEIAASPDSSVLAAQPPRVIEAVVCYLGPTLVSPGMAGSSSSGRRTEALVRKEQAQAQHRRGPEPGFRNHGDVSPSAFWLDLGRNQARQRFASARGGYLIGPRGTPKARTRPPKRIDRASVRLLTVNNQGRKKNRDPRSRPPSTFASFDIENRKQRRSARTAGRVDAPPRVEVADQKAR